MQWSAGRLADVWGALLLGTLLWGGAAAGEPTFGIASLIATECTRYFTWQTIGMVHSFRKVAQPGSMTRLMSCTQETWAKLPEADRAYVDEVPTVWAPAYSLHPRTGDSYTGINKPVAMAHWLAVTDVQEDYVLLIDADMIMRLPVLPHVLGAKPGTAVSGFFGYMIGVEGPLALRHVPEVEPRMDDVAGPVGRRGDQVGGFTMMHREDLRRVAPWWIKYSEDVRADPLAWNQTGDVYATEGEPCWIAEMYGYSFGCAKAGVWHVTDYTFQLYPGYEVSREHFVSPPKVLHYGILYNVTGDDPAAEPLYTFDKHWFEEFDALACPPWELDKTGLFRHPPSPSVFNTSGLELFRDLLALQVLISLNEAFCERHRRMCPPSEQLERECGTAEALARELEEALAQVKPPQDEEGPPGGSEAEAEHSAPSREQAQQAQQQQGHAGSADEEGGAAAGAAAAAAAHPGGASLPNSGQAVADAPLESEGAPGDAAQQRQAGQDAHAEL